nr:MAG TPA: hypothetical protein [Caudoviricetes sp.]
MLVPARVYKTFWLTTLTDAGKVAPLLHFSRQLQIFGFG